MPRKVRSKLRRPTLEEMREIARRKGGECLSTEYINAHTKLRWRCSEGHEWDTLPNNVKKGHWCPYCAGLVKLTIEQMQKIARERDGECLSSKYINCDTKLRWRCSKGHEWVAIPYNIKKGHWCPYCAGRVRSTIGNMHEIAKERGGECLSTEYVNDRTRLRWRCSEGHEWEATPNNVKRGTWCPICGYIKAGKARRLGLDEMQKLAKERGGECLSEEYVNANTKLRWRCSKGHEWGAMPSNIKSGQWCPACGGSLRLTIEEMQKLAKERGGECLSEEYVNANTKLRWRCSKGHEWEAIPSRVKGGSWCPTCAGRVRLTINEMQKLAKERGGECLSRKYVNNTTKLRWQCSEGHEWWAPPKNIAKGSWCPFCAGKIKQTIEDMQEIARGRGGECLSSEYINGKIKLRWRCGEGHEWGATSYSIKRGSWCPYCAGRVRLTIEEMREIARRKGGECLSTEYVNAQTKLKWRCSKGHEWEAIPLSIKRGSWCPTCFGPRKYTIEDMQGLAKELDGKCLSTEYINTRTKLRWRCSKGHEWEASPANIKRGRWCPYCAYGERGTRKLTIEDMQEIARHRGGKCLSKKYINSKSKLRWRCSKGHEWETIPYNVKKGTWCPVCGRIKAGKARRLGLEKMKKIARHSGGECISTKYVNAQTKLKWRCSKGHEWDAIPTHIKRGSWCPYCAGRVRLTIEEMQSIAKERGGECLSTEYINANTKLRWRCRKGHEWDAIPLSIKRGSWCPICGRIKAGKARRLGLEEMQKIAGQRGGECLLEEYVNANTKLRWRCKLGHEWEAIPSNIKRGQWCPYCSGKVKLTLEDMQQIARERGGECLSTEYINAHTKLRWRCSRGHEWDAVPHSIKRGSWCPTCFGSPKATIEDMHKIAKHRGGECLSTEYINNQTKLRWKCKLGHEWEATPGHIKSGRWCPYCAGTRKKWGMCVFFPGIRDPIYGDDGQIIGCIEHYEYYRKRKRRKKLCADCRGPRSVNRKKNTMH